MKLASVAVAGRAQHPQFTGSNSVAIAAPEGLLDGLEQTLAIMEGLSPAEERAAQDIEAAIQRCRSLSVKHSSVPLLVRALSEMLLTDVDTDEVKQAAAIGIATLNCAAKN